MPSTLAWAGTTVTLAGVKTYLSRAGSGPALLVLHHDIGTPERLPFYDLLAERFTVLVPHHPGWGR
ncbi:MAG: hypothetical protein JOY66_07605, partial [Acetobacteraceae bacterium]|nr:hypothetical protein [Acetobacteraceae bacterium]